MSTTPVISLCTTTEINLDTDQPSDITIHFKDHAYHCHSQILIHATRYFADLAEPDEKCEVSTRCGMTGHQCLTLPDAIGGSEVDTSEMTQLFELMYNPGLLVNSMATNMSLKQCNHYIFLGALQRMALLEINIADGSTNVSIDTQTVLKLGPEQQTLEQEVHFCKSHSAEITGRDTLLQFVNKYHVTIQLASYFHCKRLLSAIENCAMALVSDAALMQQYDALWEMLIIADRYQMKVLPELLSFLSKDTKCMSRVACQKATDDMKARRSFETLTTILTVQLNNALNNKSTEQ